MGFDAILKRYFAAAICLLLGVAAYLQASGMGQLVASSVGLDPSAVPIAPVGPRHAAAAPAASDHTTTAAAILTRNPFDSVTGPLDGKTIDLPAPTMKDDSSRDPYDDPACDTAKVLMIVASDDPQWSFAALSGPGGKSVLRRQGDDVSGQIIGDLRTEERRKSDPRNLYDRVWLTSANGSRCQMEVGGKTPVKAAPTEKKKARACRTRSPRASTRRARRSSTWSAGSSTASWRTRPT